MIIEILCRDCRQGAAWGAGDCQDPSVWRVRWQEALYLLVIRGNGDGETVSFQYYDGVTKTALDKTVKFVVNSKMGNVVAPFMLAQKLNLFG